LALVDEQIAIAGSEDEAGPELEGIFSEAMLAVARRLGTCSCFGIVAAQQMKQVPRFQFRNSIGGPLGIHQQRERDTGLLAKQAGVIQVAQSNRRQLGPGLLKLVFVLAQLRDMLAAEDSAIVPQEDNYGGTSLPQRAELDIAAASFRQHNIRQLRAERFRHVTDCIGSFHRPGRLTACDKTQTPRASA
jgi:hypothetical protein